MDDELTARLERWAADGRMAEAVQQRSRAQWLRRQSEEEGSMVGVLADLAERRATVVAQLLGGRSRHGVVQALGHDFVALRSRRSQDVLVALAAVWSVGISAADITVGDRSALESPLSLKQVLVGLCAERGEVVLMGQGGGDPLSGVIRAVGDDVVMVASERAGLGGVSYVPLKAISEVILA